MTLVSTESSELFTTHEGEVVGPAWSLFRFFGPEVGRWVAVGLLALAAAHILPAVTGTLHYWVSASFAATAVPLDGGDHVGAALTLLLIPLSVLDIKAVRERRDRVLLRLLRTVACSARVAATIQVMIIYFHAAVSKLAVEEWADGTATYYWFNHPWIGASDELLYLLGPVLQTPWVCLLTWGAVLLELCLSAAPLLSRELRRALFVSGVLFHWLIAILHGLISFSLAMIGALLLLTEALDEIPLRQLAVRSVRGTWETLSKRLGIDSEVGALPSGSQPDPR